MIWATLVHVGASLASHSAFPDLPTADPKQRQERTKRPSPAATLGRRSAMGSTGETATVAHGYSMADVDRASRKAVTAARAWTGVDYSERFEAAWFGIVDALLTSEEPLTFRELVTAGMTEIGRINNDFARHHGVGREGIRPAFNDYWITIAKVGRDSDGFAERVAERLSLPQVLSCLTPAQYESLMALAVYGDQRAAAAAIGVTPNTFSARIQRARRHIKELWFEHETPAGGTGFGRGDDERCASGHLRSEHGHKVEKIRDGVLTFNWVCTICRNRSALRGYHRRKSPAVA